MELPIQKPQLRDDALKAEFRPVSARQSLAERLRAIADELAVLAKPGGHDMTKHEVDAMWGHPDIS